MSTDRLRMKLILERRETEHDWPVRQLSRSDIPGLGQLMLDSFRDTVDYEGEELPDAVAEVTRTFDGEYGPLLPECTLGVEQDGILASACLVTLIEERRLPFLAFSMTSPAHLRRGMAGFLIARAANKLIDLGHPELALVVTATNAPARRLYERLGFRPARPDTSPDSTTP